MNKFKIPIILIGALIFGESAGIIYFAGKSQDLSKKLETMAPDYQKLEQEDQELKNKLTALIKEHEALKVDRDNVLAQAKSLMGERSRANELAASLEKTNLKLSQFQNEKKESQNFILSIKNKIGKLQQEQARLIKERDDLKAAYAQINSNIVLSDLRKENASLVKIKSGFENSLKNKDKEIERFKDQIKKLEATNEHLTGQIKDQKKSIIEATKKNNRLEQEIKNLPKKFTETARQNTKLIKDTSEMHYNLGVFYTKNKEYERAVAEFNKVVEIAPDDAYAHFNLGYIYSEYLVDRSKAVEHFRRYLTLAKAGDKDIEWVKKYLLTWEAYEGKKAMQ